jgi:hypothetical protein
MTSSESSALRGAFLFVAVSAILLTPSLNGQSAGTGALAGTVTDSTGR